ncbi:hypothetical protein IV203_025464 [Nitzschia inconspicua]|uniref:Uncharacterized protein n=1 Tax=Nitzschia inconspicua TaxID=303405 RepID=A0A9K3LIY0_9STRA|nr:hypothetical protein IV203_028246 [Nitzschia inconspicua]KAG7362580.1 hypothetical protein IV203_025464 [Nitzschia inconspicua]
MDFTLSTITSATPMIEDVVTGLFRSLLISSSQEKSRRRFNEKDVAMSRILQQQQQHLAQGYLSNTYTSLLSSKKSFQDIIQNEDDSDDDTASTMTATSIEDDEEEEEEEEDVPSTGSLSLITGFLSSLPSIQSARRVSFATPLVTSIHHRPFCTEEDKYYLHYSEHDYIDFKLEYLTKGNSPLVRRTPRKVGFARDVVTSTHIVLGKQERDQLSLYYNEDELQHFLDDFVASLQQQQHNYAR